MKQKRTDKHESMPQLFICRLKDTAYPRFKVPERLKLVVQTIDGYQTLECGHSVALPPFCGGSYPRIRHCPECFK